MPIYEYICKDCSQKFEAVRSFSEADEPIACSQCGGTNTKRMVSRCWSIGDGGDTFSAVSSGGCSGCAGGNCAHCHS